MADSATVIVEKVDGPNANGWYDVTFDASSPEMAGEKAATKNEELAKAAFQSRGTEVPASISKTTNGKFTNVYLNEIDGVKDGFKGSRKAAGTTTAKSGRTPAENDRIARQWAYGRAVELLIGSGAEFPFPLDSATKSAIADEANWLLGSTKE